MSMAFEDLEELFVDERPALLGLIERHTRCRAEAEDIIQEAFCRALVNAASLDATKAGGWLTTVAKRLAVDSWRHKGKHLYFGEWEADSHTETVDPTEQIHERELARAASSYVEQLPAPQRDALLGVAEGFSVAQLADRHSSTKRAVEGHLRRGRSVIRKHVLA